MALIKCTECGKEISDRTEACPNCAYPITELNEKHITAPEQTQAIVIQQVADISLSNEHPEMDEEAIRAREERRRKKREAARIRKRKAKNRKIIIISASALICIIAIFVFRDVPTTRTSNTPSANNSEEPSVKAGGISKSEAKELAEEKAVSKLWAALHSSSYSNYDIGSSKYNIATIEAEPSYGGDGWYTCTVRGKILLYDKYGDLKDTATFDVEVSVTEEGSAVAYEPTINIQ